MQARPRAASGTRDSAAGSIVTCAHQHGWSLPAAIAQALGRPQIGQRLGSQAPGMAPA
jgi:hypothetical protein